MIDSASTSSLQTKGFPPCPDNIPHGFLSLHIPEQVRVSCQQHILSYFKELQPQLDLKNSHKLEGSLTDIASSFTDDDFVSVFIKGMRTFPLRVSELLIPWLNSEVKDLLGANQVALTHVSKLDQDNNKTLTPEDYDVYWRCVRPNKNDVAGPHKDSQFANLNIGSDRAIPLPFEYKERWRIWFPLFGCHADNSLQLVKDSYKEEIPFTSIDTVNGPRPTIRESWIAKNQSRFESPYKNSSTGVLFRDDVVHQGPKNKGPNVRISAEFTLLTR